MIKNIKWLLIASLSFVACNDDDTTVTEEPVTPGSANFTKYVALGDSFAAGFSDGALFLEGQKNAYPNILAKQFVDAGGGLFNSPFMVDNVGGFSLNGVQLTSTSTRLYFGIPLGGDIPEPIFFDGISGTSVTSVLPAGAYNNMGVPGAKCTHLVVPGYAMANPYFKRFASANSTTIMADALVQQPTFFSLWIGGNDVLGYALAGGDSNLAQITPLAGSPGVGFEESYDMLINNLTANGRKGVIANLPYITTLPQFTYINPKAVVDPFKYFVDGDEKKASRKVSDGDKATINSINTILGFLDQVLTAYGQPDRFNLLSNTSANPVIIKDPELANFGNEIKNAAAGSGNSMLIALADYLGATFGQVRQTKAGDMIPIGASVVIGTSATLPPGVPSDLGKYGITYPLEDRSVLVPSEVAEIISATDGYNNKIKSIADSKKGQIAFVDAKAIMDQLVKGGIRYGNYHMTASFVSGGAFSLDGIHPSARGYALIANKFIEAINKEFGSTLKAVDLSTYRMQYPKSL